MFAVSVKTLTLIILRFIPWQYLFLAVHPSLESPGFKGRIEA